MIYNETVIKGGWYDELSDEKKLRKEYAQTLKEMDRLESEYKKLKSEYKKLTKKAYDIECQLTSIDKRKVEDENHDNS